MRELEHIRDHYPDVYSRIGKSAFNKKLGRKYLRLGLYYERNGELTKARAAYKQAMLLRKWSLSLSLGIHPLHPIGSPVSHWLSGVLASSMINCRE